MSGRSSTDKSMLSILKRGVRARDTHVLPAALGSGISDVCPGQSKTLLDIVKYGTDSDRPRAFMQTNGKAAFRIMSRI